MTLFELVLKLRLRACRLPELNKDPVALEKICDEYDLQPRGSSGEHSAAVGAKWDISNKQRIGLTEVCPCACQCVLAMIYVRVYILSMICVRATCVH